MVVNLTRIKVCPASFYSMSFFLRGREKGKGRVLHGIPFHQKFFNLIENFLDFEEH